MTSKAETVACRALRAALQALPIGSPIPDTDERQECLTALERVLPAVLATSDRFWDFESLDGIVPHLAQRIGADEAEIFGLCILITDQTLTPLHVRLGIDHEADRLSWLECKIGERDVDNGGLRRMPYSRLTKELARLGDRSSDIGWAYSAQIDQRR